MVLLQHSMTWAPGRAVGAEGVIPHGFPLEAELGRSPPAVPLEQVFHVRVSTGEGAVCQPRRAHTPAAPDARGG